MPREDVPEVMGMSDDLLFSPCGKPRYNACMNFVRRPHGGYDLYAQGYRRAAHILVEHVEGSGRNQDTLIHPIVFLARQYFELKFKYLLTQLCTLIGRQPSFRKGHGLEKLWDECAALIREAGLNEADEAIEEITGYIKEFHRVDPTSQAFRYPIGTQGNPLLPEIKYIDILNLHERTVGVEERLESLDSYLQVAIDAKREFDQLLAYVHGINEPLR